MAYRAESHSRCEKHCNNRSFSFRTGKRLLTQKPLRLSFSSRFLPSDRARKSEEDGCFLARTGRESQRYSITGQRLVVGCIPYRLKEEKQEDDSDKPCSSSCMEEMMEVLLISSQKGGDEIMFPKGGWEKDESIEDAARREAWEEAGVMGTVQLKEFLGKWSFKSKRYGTMYDGFMFPLHVTEELDPWPEMNVRQRRWVTVAKARESCKHFWMKEALEKLVEHLSNANVGELSMKESLEKLLSSLSNSADKP